MEHRRRGGLFDMMHVSMILLDRRFYAAADMPVWCILYNINIGMFSQNFLPIFKGSEDR